MSVVLLARRVRALQRYLVLKISGMCHCNARHMLIQQYFIMHVGHLARMTIALSFCMRKFATVCILTLRDIFARSGQTSANLHFFCVNLPLLAFMPVCAFAFAFVNAICDCGQPF